MPLEGRVQLPRTVQRNRRRDSLRQHPYRLTSRLHGTRAHDNLQTHITGEDVQLRAPYKAGVKRAGYGACTCISYDEQMPADEARAGPSLGDQAAESQRLSVDQRPQTNLNERTWQMERSLRFQHVTHTSSSNSSFEADATMASTSSTGTSINSDSILSLSIPNTVPNAPISPRTNAPNSVRSPTGDPCLRPTMLPLNSVPTVDSLCEKSTHNDAQCMRHARRCREDCSMSLSALLRLSKGSKADMPPATEHARQVANRIIKHARDNKTPDERALRCPDCARLPAAPVTGPCGHTRCSTCIEDNGACPCGVEAPKSLHVNTLIQDLIKKISRVQSDERSCGEGTEIARRTQPARKLARASLPGISKCLEKCIGARVSGSDMPPHTLMSVQARFGYAWKLLKSGRYREAAPHFARVAACPNALAKTARAILAQILTVLSGGGDPRRLTRGLYRAVRAQAATTWLRPSDLECVLCYLPYSSPVTTPCGHTYCRTCIERSMDYKKSCALCLRSLDDFNLASTRDTAFVCAALTSIDALSPPPPPDPDVIPIFVCTVAYPAIPCPLFIFDPRYWLMIRRVLESESRKFGMVAYERDRSYSDFGTVLEVRDCVHLEDGRSILSTVGVSRFRVIKRDVRDGCDVARIQPLTDITPTEELVIWELRLMATQISYKALLWLNSMNQSVRSEIEAAFGWLPRVDQCHEWWLTPDGPAWLWWLIAILPLRSEIKILILSTKNLLKRMMAVSRTLEAIEQVAISATASSECELRNALSHDEWI